MREFIIKKPEEGQRFDRYLEKLLPGAGKSFLYKMMRKKNITLNNGLAKGPEKLCEGDVIKVWFSDETFELFSAGSARVSTPAAQEKRLATKQKDFIQKPTVLFENEHILVISKPAGLLSQKADKNDYSANEWILEYLTEQGIYSKESYGSFIPAAVNRLDRNTSGILLVGKTRAGSAYLSELLREHSTQKTYQTFVCGEIKDACGYISSFSKNAKTNVSSLTGTRSYNPATEIESEKACREKDVVVTEVYPISYNATYDMTYCNIRLITGKSHQIRVQLSEIGHPLLGDSKYGYKKTHKTYPLMQEMAEQKDYPMKNGELMHVLHAACITLPKNELLPEAVTVKAELPSYTQLLKDKFN